MTAPNAELAYKVLDHIDAFPEEWDQTVWTCGSAACFAGWALNFSGAKISENTFPTKVVAGPGDLVGQDVDVAACMALGITERQSEVGEEWLFDSANGREDLGRLVAEIFGPRPVATS